MIRRRRLIHSALLASPALASSRARALGPGRAGRAIRGLHRQEREDHRADAEREPRVGPVGRHAAEGPERIAMQWWRDEAGHALTRDYFRVESRQGLRGWLYRDGLYGNETGNPRWFLHGLFA